METFVILLFATISIIGLGIPTYMLYRNPKVCTFRGKLIDMCGDYNHRHIDEYIMGDDNDAFVWLYYKVPSYSEMLWSFKPLTLESYLTEEQYERLIN